LRICRFNDGRVGVVDAESVIDVTSIIERLPKFSWPLPRGDVFIAALNTLMPELKRLSAVGEHWPLKGVRLLSPVANPGKIIGAPVNYALHLEEGRRDPGIHHNQPVKTIAEYGLFLKATSALVGPGDGVVSNRSDRRTDHELELAVVIGKAGRYISSEAALEHVAGYAIALDMTIRGTEDRSQRKSLDSFAVLGPWLVTPDEFGDPGDAELELTIDGRTRQKANTRELIFNVPRLIEYASQHYTLEPGDIIMTGTPAGVGPVEPGDVLQCRIDRIGTMSVAVRSE
jgi:2-keto-4-pentenoate hydratase/2-oxohepta-3-ene-1,7-dioic acid hydratase in catechol pathway